MIFRYKGSSINHSCYKNVIMTRRCIKCKVAPSSTANRSFHYFPKNDEEKLKKWMSALQLTKTPNLNTSYVCSDHFQDEDFFYTDEQRQKRRLRPEAIPYCQVKVVVDISIRSDSRCDSSVSVLMNNTKKCIKHEETIHKSISLNGKAGLTNCNSNQKVICNDLQTTECPLSNLPFDGASENVCDDLALTNSLINDAANEDTNKKSVNCKRKGQLTDTNPSKKIRVTDGKRTEFFSRKNFTSDTAWDNFMWYVRTCRRDRKIVQKQISTKLKKLKNYKEAIDTLKERDEFSAAEYLKDLPQHLKELILRIKNRKATQAFPINLQNFARTLHFHSPAAYNVIRQSFLNCLPAPRTLHSWISKKQYKPGISEDVISHVSGIVEAESTSELET